jgi:protein deglycase
MKKALLLLATGFEEVEAITPMDLLRRAGVQVVSASLQADLCVKGSHGISILADRTLDACLAESFDLLILPGGPGTVTLRQDERVLGLVKRYHESGLLVAAICAAPLVLADAGIVAGLALTSFPGTEEELKSRVRVHTGESVTRDGKVITARAAGSSEEFALELIHALLGRASAESVRERIAARP